MVYFSFVIDVFSRRIVGWQLAGHMRTTLVLDALRMALSRRRGGAERRARAPFRCRIAARTQPVVATVVLAVNVSASADGGLVLASRWAWKAARLSSRRLARRAGRSGDSRARARAAPGVWFRWRPLLPGTCRALRRAS